VVHYLVESPWAGYELCDTLDVAAEAFPGPGYRFNYDPPQRQLHMASFGGTDPGFREVFWDLPPDLGVVIVYELSDDEGDADTLEALGDHALFPDAFVWQVRYGTAPWPPQPGPLADVIAALEGHIEAFREVLRAQGRDI
jgi:hypothetical protein